MKPHRFHPEADEEYADAATHYANISRELGARFYDEIERLIADACTAPRRFRKIDGDVRRHLRTIFLTRCFTSMTRTVFGSSRSCH